MHTDAEVARRFRAAHRWVKDQSAMVPIALGTLNHIEDPFPVPTVTHGWAAGDASYASGAFELADDEALVMKGRSPECVFWNMCLWNQFLHCFNYDYDDVTTNGSKVELDADGSWTIVVAATDPGGAQLGFHPGPGPMGASGSGGSCPSAPLTQSAPRWSSWPSWASARALLRSGRCRS